MKLRCVLRSSFVFDIMQASKSWIFKEVGEKISEISEVSYLSKFSAPGDGLGTHTDRDQRSWVFLNDPKNTLPLTENKKKLS